MTNTINPLAELRRQGYDADLHENRLRVWPRHKISEEECRFITDNLPEIVQELIVETNFKTINNFFLWELPVGDREGNELMPGEIPSYMNGQQFAGVSTPGV